MSRCAQCGDPRARANLTAVLGDLVCPECLYAEALASWSAPHPAAPPQPSTSGAAVIGITQPTKRRAKRRVQ